MRRRYRRRLASAGTAARRGVRRLHARRADERGARHDGRVLRPAVAVRAAGRTRDAHPVRLPRRPVPGPADGRRRCATRPQPGARGLAIPTGIPAVVFIIWTPRCAADGSAALGAVIVVSLLLGVRAAYRGRHGGRVLGEFARGPARPGLGFAVPVAECAARRATTAAFSLTVHNASSSPYTLRVMTSSRWSSRRSCWPTRPGRTGSSGPGSPAGRCR